MEDVPPGMGHYAAVRHIRAPQRSNTVAEVTYQPQYTDFRSAHPSSKSFAPIDESVDLPALPFSYQTASPDHTPESSPSTSATASTSSTPSTSPPALSYDRPAVPYEDGPVQILPGIYLGAEESALDLSWVQGNVVRIMNVAQEIEDPFGCRSDDKVKLAEYYSSHGLKIEYCHLRWSHGEGGLAGLPTGASLVDLIQGKEVWDAESWGFWDAVGYLEAARKSGVPVLIQ